MKRILSLMLALCLVCTAFAGCKSKDGEKIVGKWRSEITDDTNPEQVLVTPGSVQFEFYEDQNGLKTVYGVKDEFKDETYFTYSLDGNVIVINLSNGVTDDYQFRFEDDDILYFFDPSLDATEKFVRVR